MSNAMSRSKSRWKGALLATVAGAAITPVLAKAQNMSVGLYLSPPGGSSPKQLEYLSPDQNNTDIPIYVYATVTGVTTLTGVSGTTAAVISTGQFDGLQYLYYNVNASSGSLGGVAGGIDGTPVLNAPFNAPASNGSGSGFGSQTGTVQLSSTSAALGANTSVLALGSNLTGGITSTSITDFAKPRAASAVWSDYASFNAVSGTFTYKNDGTNIIIGANSVSFLVETLNYKPTAFTASTSSTSLTSTVLTAIAPTSLLTAAGFTPSNYFLDSTSSLPGTQSNASGGSLSGITKSGYTAPTSGLGTVTLTDTLPGDATRDGTVNFSDLGLVLTHYGATDTSWSDGNFLYGGNSADTVINFSDLGLVLTNYGGNLGATPTVVVDAALLADPNAVALLESDGVTPVAAVPEPVSLALVGLLGGGALLRRRNKTLTV
jgi:hypothetical protein